MKKNKQCSIGARNRNIGQGYERRLVNKLKKRFKYIIPRKFKVKDLTDFVKKYGLIKTKEYVEQIKKRFE